MNEFVPYKLAALAELGDGEAIGRPLPRDDGVRPLILTRDRDTVSVFLNSCPHTGVRLDWKPGQFLDVDERYLQCSMHGALFERATGACIAGPCVGEHLYRVTARVCGKDIVVDARENIPQTALKR